MKNDAFKDKIVDTIIILLLSFLPRIILCLYAYPLRTVHDEVATIAAGALYAGKDWSGVMSNASYYGFGMSTIFSPVFAISKNPITIYRILLIFCSILQGCIAFITNSIINKYFELKDRKINIAIAVICSYVVVTRSIVFYNEHALILSCWIIVWLILYLNKNVDNKNKKTIATIALGFVIIYTLTLHTRSLTFLIALIILIILYKVLYNKWIINLAVFLFITIIGTVLVNLLIGQYQDNYWGKVIDTIGNTKIDVVSIFDLVNMNAVNAMFKIIVGQVSTLMIITGGLFGVGFVLFIDLFKNMIIHWKNKHALTLKERQLFIVTFYCFICTGITIIAQAVSPGWLLGVMRLLAEETSKNGYSFKAMTYIRYVGPYIGPIVFCVLVIFHEAFYKLIKYLKYAFILIIVVEILWIAFILPHMYECGDASEAFLPFTFGKVIGEGVTQDTFLLGTLVLFNVIIIWCLLYLKNKKFMMLLFIGCFYIYQYFYNGVNYDIYTQKNNYLKVNTSYELIKKLENNIKIPEEIYVYDVKETIHKIDYLYQFYLSEYKIISQIPKKDEVILFINSDDLSEKLVREGYLYVQLEENQYLYVKGKNLQKSFINQNVDLKNEMEKIK